MSFGLDTGLRLGRRFNFLASAAVPPCKNQAMLRDFAAVTPCKNPAQKWTTDE